jgi:uncharacterized repeat protein (TIGR01451 family)/LPXTG-motif cell wall-anchored protein
VNPRSAPARRYRARGRLAALVVGLVLGGAALPAGPASAAVPAPVLSIAIDNGHTSTKAGETLKYTISVKNLGSAGVNGLRVSQTMPTGLTFVSAERGGTVEGKAVVWSVDLKASSALTLRTSMRVGTTPDEVLRMATVACAGLSAKKAPIVCATHSDELPAGARATAATAARTARSTGTDGSTAVVWGGAGGLVLVVAGIVVLVVRRRRA